jgi:hypothetical protein
MASPIASCDLVVNFASNVPSGRRDPVVSGPVGSTTGLWSNLDRVERIPLKSERRAVTRLRRHDLGSMRETGQHS